MYAVIKTGGKQYRVQAGAIIRIEKLEEQVGNAVTFSQVLMVGDGDNIEIGKPLLEGRQVKGVVVQQGKSRKVVIVKMRRRKHYMRRGTHRQQFTAVKIDAIA